MWRTLTEAAHSSAGPSPRGRLDIILAGLAGLAGIAGLAGLAARLGERGPGG